VIPHHLPRPLPLLAEADELSPVAAAWLGSEPGTPAPGTAAPGTRPALAAPADPAPDPRLYWHLADRRGVLRRYEVRAVSQRLVVQVPRRLLRGGNVLRVWFGGYSAAYWE